MGNFNEALGVSVIGFGIVFAVLVILWIVLELYRPIFHRKNKDMMSAVPASEPAKASIAVDKAPEEAELIAVLTAAAAACMGLRSTYNLKIQSYRRIESNTPVWNSVSRKENLENRF